MITINGFPQQSTRQVIGIGGSNMKELSNISVIWRQTPYLTYNKDNGTIVAHGLKEKAKDYLSELLYAKVYYDIPFEKMRNTEIEKELLKGGNDYDHLTNKRAGTKSFIPAHLNKRFQAPPEWWKVLANTIEIYQDVSFTDTLALGYASTIWEFYDLMVEDGLEGIPYHTDNMMVPRIETPLFSECAYNFTQYQKVEYQFGDIDTNILLMQPSEEVLNCYCNEDDTCVLYWTFLLPPDIAKKFVEIMQCSWKNMDTLLIELCKADSSVPVEELREKLTKRQYTNQVPLIYTLEEFDMEEIPIATQIYIDDNIDSIQRVVLALFYHNTQLDTKPFDEYAGVKAAYHCIFKVLTYILSKPRTYTQI